MSLLFGLFIALVSQSTATLYDIRDEVCCGGNVLQLSVYERKDMRCCGTAVYNHSTSRCCDGHVLDMPDNLFNSKTLACCGDTFYDYTVNKNNYCCKNRLYSRQNQKCNYETGDVMDRNGSLTLEFCGTQVYNTTSQICGYSNVADISICNKDGKLGATLCCGNTSYNFQQEICCDDTIHPLYPNPDNLTIVNECCGRSIFQLDGYLSYLDRSNFICCGDVFVERSSINEGCCGSQIYNVSDSVCCNGVVIENPAINHICCGTATFNPATSICCNGNVYPLKFFSSQDCCEDSEMLNKGKPYYIVQFYNGSPNLQKFRLESGPVAPFGAKNLQHVFFGIYNTK